MLFDDEVSVPEMLLAIGSTPAIAFILQRSSIRSVVIPERISHLQNNDSWHKPMPITKMQFRATVSLAGVANIWDSACVQFVCPDRQVVVVARPLPPFPAAFASQFNPWNDTHSPPLSEFFSLLSPCLSQMPATPQRVGVFRDGRQAPRHFNAYHNGTSFGCCHVLREATMEAMRMA
jgi:hypothetical protein